MEDNPGTASSPQSWRPLALAAGVFVVLLGGAVLPTLLSDKEQAEVFSTPALSGVGDVQVGLGCKVRGRILETTWEFRTNGGFLTSYAYDFGDGSEPRTFQVDDDRPNLSAVYTYARAGRYVVSLRAKTAKATGEDTCTIEVR